MNKSENNKNANTGLNSSIGYENKEAKKAYIKYRKKCRRIKTLLQTLQKQQQHI